MKTLKNSLALAVLAALTITFGMLPAPAAHAQAAPLRVYASNAVHSVLEDLRAQCEKSIGRPLDIHYGSSANIKKSLDAGEDFDVAILSSQLVDTLIQSGKMAPNSHTDIARSGIGAGIRAGAPKPDISTPETMKSALLHAKSVSYVKDGAASPYVVKMIDGLGIAAPLAPKTVLEPSTDSAAADVASGKTEIMFSMISEVMAGHGIELAGPLPPEFQTYLVFSAGISAKSSNVPAVKAFLKFLTDSSVAPTLKAKGMEQPNT